MMVGRGSAPGQIQSRRVVGLHLMPLTNAVDERRPSVLIELDRDRALSDLRLLTTLDEIVAALPGEATLLAVDQPLVVTNQTGKRDILVPTEDDMM